MMTPCRAACKNKDGICSGCQRTIDEIIQWKHFSLEQKQEVMAQLSGEKHTHTCPRCGEPSYCAKQEGKDVCWCMTVEERSIPDSLTGQACLCRRCLLELDIA